MKHGSRGRECVCTLWICVCRKDAPYTHTLTNTCAHTIWLDICTNDRVLVDSAEVPSWLDGGGDSHHKIPPIFKAPVQLKVMVSIQVARLGLSCHHRCIYWQPCFIFCLGWPRDWLRNILCWLEMSLLSLAGVLEVPALPAKGNRPSSFYPPVCNCDLWTAQLYASHIKPMSFT